MAYKVSEDRLCRLAMDLRTYWRKPIRKGGNMQLQVLTKTHYHSWFSQSARKLLIVSMLLAGVSAVEAKNSMDRLKTKGGSMVTTVGTQENFADSVKALVKLDRAIIDVYDTAIGKLECDKSKAKLKEFKADHERHVSDLSALLRKHGEIPPEDAATMEKVMDLFNVKVRMTDLGVLKAMLSGEENTNEAYSRVSGHKGQWDDALETIKRGLEDEKRHKAWLENTIENSK